MEPDTMAEWQQIVDAADAALLSEAAYKAGLLRRAPHTDVARCEELLARGAALGVQPARLREPILPYAPQPVVPPERRSWFKEARMDARLSLKQAAAQAGVSIATLTLVESGQVEAAPALARRLAALYGVDSDKPRTWEDDG